MFFILKLPSFKTIPLKKPLSMLWLLNIKLKRTPTSKPVKILTLQTTLILITLLLSLDHIPFILKTLRSLALPPLAQTNGVTSIKNTPIMP
jgi:hypothetical protein